MAVLINHQPINFSGSQSFGPVTVTDGLNALVVRLARCTTATPTFWPNAVTSVDAQLELSMDGGATWESAGGLGSVGGINTLRGGGESTETVLRCPLRSGNARRLRATVTVVNGPLVSQLTVETV